METINWSEILIEYEEGSSVTTLGEIISNGDFDINTFEIDPLTGGLTDIEFSADGREINWFGFKQAVRGDYALVFTTR